MKKLFTIVSMTLIIPALTSCGGGPKGDMPWIVDRFDDIKVIRYEVPGFDALPLEEKELIYYLSEAAKCGRDILFDQNCPVNLPVRRTLETVYENYKGDRTTAEWKALEKYLKKVWFANGIHHHYSNDKFVPEFTEGYLLDAIETIPEEKFGSLNSLRGEVCRAIFDPALYPTKLNQKAGDDLLLTSSSNYYHNVSQAEAEAFYADMAAADAGNPEPVSYGLNSQLTKDDAGRICERVWKLGGMYSPAIERIVYWLEKAQAVAKEPQKTNIAALVSYYKTGDLKEFDRYNIGWVKDTVSNVDFVNGFIEDYGDPLGRKASRPRSSPWRCSAATAIPRRPSASTCPMPTGFARSTARSRSPSTTSPMPTTWLLTATVSTRSSCSAPRTASGWSGTASWPTTCTPTCMSAWAASGRATARRSKRPAPTCSGFTTWVIRSWSNWG